MAQAEANQVVQSYLEGLRNTLSRQQLTMEQQRFAAEKQQRDQELQQHQAELDEIVKQHGLAQKAAAANFQLNVGQHAAEYAQNNEPDVDPATGKPVVDAKGVGQYTVAGPDGNPLTFHAPTREQQANLQLLNLKKQQQATSDIEQTRQMAVQGQQQQYETGLESRREAFETQQSELSRAQQTAQSIREGNIQGQLRKMEIDAQAGQQSRLLNWEKQKELIEQTGDTSSLTGGTPGVVPDQIRILGEAALDGKLSKEQLLTGFAKTPGIIRGVQNYVTQNGGTVLPAAKIAALDHMQSLVQLIPKMKTLVDRQDAYTTGSGSPAMSAILGPTRALTDPILNQDMESLNGQMVSIGKGVGSEEGQRISNLMAQTQEGAYIPSLHQSVGVNRAKIRNIQDQARDTVMNETLGGIPDKQKATLAAQRGFTTLLDPKILSTIPQQGQQETPTGQLPQAPAGQTSYPDPNSFFLSK